MVQVAAQNSRKHMRTGTVGVSCHPSILTHFAMGGSDISIHSFGMLSLVAAKQQRRVVGSVPHSDLVVQHETCLFLEDLGVGWSAVLD